MIVTHPHKVELHVHGLTLTITDDGITPGAPWDEVAALNALNNTVDPTIIHHIQTITENFTIPPDEPLTTIAARLERAIHATTRPPTTIHWRDLAATWQNHR